MDEPSGEQRVEARCSFTTVVKRPASRELRLKCDRPRDMNGLIWVVVQSMPFFPYGTRPDVPRVLAYLRLAEEVLWSSPGNKMSRAASGGAAPSSQEHRRTAGPPYLKLSPPVPRNHGGTYITFEAEQTNSSKSSLPECKESCCMSRILPSSVTLKAYGAGGSKACKL